MNLKRPARAAGTSYLIRFGGNSNKFVPDLPPREPGPPPSHRCLAVHDARRAPRVYRSYNAFTAYRNIIPPLIGNSKHLAELGVTPRASVRTGVAAPPRRAGLDAPYVIRVCKAARCIKRCMFPTTEPYLRRPFAERITNAKGAS